MFSPHPPEIVTLDTLPDGTLSPQHNSSPLSSTPNSPRGSPVPEDLDHSTLASSFIDDLEAYEERKKQRQQKMVLSDIAPFDESGNKKENFEHPHDEKKTNEGDELMMGSLDQQTTEHLFDGQQHDNEEEIEPPSLSKAQITSKKGSLVTPTPYRVFPEDYDPEKPSVGEGSSTNTEGKLSTPVKYLRSPPSIIKQTMAWETPNRNKGTGSIATVSPSPGRRVQPSHVEDDVPADETQDTETPIALRPMVSPDGKVEYKKAASDADNDSSDATWGRLESLNRKGTDFERMEAAPPQVAPFHPQGAVNLETNVDNESDEKHSNALDDSHSIQAFQRHTRALSVPAEMQANALHEFTSTLSDAVDLATSGASDAVKLMGDLLVGADAVSCSPGTAARGSYLDSYAQEPTSLMPRSEPRPDIVRPIAGSMPRSVSDQPVSTVTKLNGDWNKYLTQSTQKTNLRVETTNSKDASITTQTTYKQITPKKDFQTSEKSAAWLQEEFQRRSVIKQEINKAIVARNGESLRKANATSTISQEMESSPTQPLNDSFANALKEALDALPPGADAISPGRMDNSLRSDDDEVAALTNQSRQSFGTRDLQAGPGHDAPQPRRLEYGQSQDEEDIPRIPIVPHIVGRQNPVLDGATAVLSSPEPAGPPSKFDGNLHHEMQQFVSTTRAALRENEVTLPTSMPEDPTVAKYGFRSLASAPLAASQPTALAAIPLKGTQSSLSTDTEVDLSIVPALVHPIDDILGIAKGDITLSLLNDNTGRNETSAKSTWANRVRGAVWRSRMMRRGHGVLPKLPQDSVPKGSPPRGRTSLPVDMDKARVAGGVRNVKATQEAAMKHLIHDEIDEAIDLFEDIIFSYYSYFKKSLDERQKNPGKQNGNTTDFKTFIAMGQHNIGILNLLKGDYSSALLSFKRALEHRVISLGEGHPDSVTTLSKVATCHFAMNEFAEAHSKFEEALMLSRKSAKTLEDRMLMAEILNNLGCLAYMSGQPSAADTFYRESLDVQFGLLSHSLYVPSRYIPKSISLNISVTRANIGFLNLVTKEIPIAVTAFENALMEQQLLMSGASTTLIATMDHLAVANLLNGDHMKAEMMFGRILELQQITYGPRDRRCFVTADKIKVVRNKGTNFEQAIDDLRKTFTLPEPMVKPSSAGNKGSPPKPAKSNQRTTSRGKANETSAPKSKKTVMKVFGSMRKKKT